MNLRAQTSYRFQQFVIDQNNGLPSNNIMSINYDDLGFLWVASDGGLTRYTGDSSITFSLNNTPFLESNTFSYTLVKDSILWAANSGEVYRVNTHELKISPLGIKDRYGNVSDMIFYNDSTFVMSTDLGFVLNFHVKQNRLEGFKLFSKEISSICSDNKNGVFLVYGDELGAYRVNPITRQILGKYPNLRSSSYSNFRSIKKLGIINVGQYYAYKYDSSKDEFVQILNSSNNLRSIEMLNDKLVTLSNDNKIYFSDEKNKIEIFDGKENEIKKITVDTAQNIIALTRNGVFIFRQLQPFTHLKEKSFSESLFKVRRSIVEDKKNRRLYFFNYEGADVWDMDKKEFIYTLGGFKNAYGVDQDASSFYVATDGAGISVINKDDMTARPFISASYTPRNYICVKKLFSGDFLLGTYTGLKLLKKNTLTPVDLSVSFEGTDYKKMLVHRIIQLKSGNLWIASSKGIFVLDDRFRVLSRYASDEASPFNMPSSEANVLLATDSGMYAGLNDGLFFIPFDGGAGNTQFPNFINANLKIISIIPDSKNRLWLSTYNGILCYDIKTKDLRAFHAPMYFNDDEFNRTSSLMASDGRIYFGSVSEYISINPDLYPPLKHNFPFRINMLKILNETGPPQTLLNISSGKRINLPTNKTQIKLFFFTEDLINTPNTRYYYKIDNTSQDWISLGELTSLNLFNLPIGEVTVRIKAFNLDDWSSADTSIVLFVPAPFYKSFWFYLLLLFIVLLISFAIYYYKKMENRKFLAFRLELGNELHDMIGTVSTKMIFAAENMMRQQKNHDPSLERIVEYSKVMNSSFRDALWSIYYNTDSLDNLVARIIEIAFQSVECTNFNLKVDKQEHISNFNLSPLQKLNILMILRESLHNVLKHSNGDQITLLIEVKNRYFYLVVSDNGKGPGSLDIDKGYGIRSMRQRASRINGDLNFIINESSFSVELTIR
jgi:ligand-binding sensor domain-containing protein